MKNLELGSKGCLPVLLYIVFALGLYIENKVEATDLKEIEKPFTSMKLSEGYIDTIDEIINGRFREGVKYLEILPFPKAEYKDDEDIDLSMIAYAYQVLGQHYMKEKDPSKAAVAYFRSLEYYPFNYELTCYLNKLGVKNFSNENIQNALDKRLKK